MGRRDIDRLSGSQPGILRSMAMSERRARIGRGARATVLVLVAFLAGCAGTRPYHSNLDRNLQLSAVAESSRVLSTMTVAVDIYSVTPDCSIDYQGTVDFGAEPIRTGIPVDRTSYLVFKFLDASFWTNSSSTLSYDAVLVPKPGGDYRIEASYLDDIYDVVIRESDRNGADRMIDRLPPNPCFTS